MVIERRAGPVGVLGGGLGGLAAACTLAARGYEVVLFERNDWLGGKAAVLERDGFRFDMGPTILTLPTVLERIFAEAGCGLAGRLELLRLDPQWRSFFEGGGVLDLFAHPERMGAELSSFSPAADLGEAYRRFIDYSARLNRVSRDFFFWKPIESLRDMFDARSSLSLSTLRDVLALKPGRTVSDVIRGHMPEPRVAQMLDHFTQYVGSSPEQSPAVLCGIAHMQTDEGVWYPRGGTAAVPQALANLARELGVEIRLQTEVRRILTQDGRAVGVETGDGERIELAAIVANVDTVRTHEDLLEGPPARAFLRRRSYEAACSGVVLYLGLARRYEHLAHHNFVFSCDPHEEFAAIYRRGEPAPDPTCYVCAPSASDPSVAPPGGEALYVLVHTPYLRPHHDWEQMFPAYRRRILDKLAQAAGMDDLESRILVEDKLTPADIHRRYGVLHGAIYGLASHGRWLGAFKPGNRSRDLAGLYFAGGSAHPGPGMPMVLMSGWIAADALDRDRVADRAEMRTPCLAGRGGP